jgi:hypothetical protein
MHEHGHPQLAKVKLLEQAQFSEIRMRCFSEAMLEQTVCQLGATRTSHSASTRRTMEKLFLHGTETLVKFPASTKVLVSCKARDQGQFSGGDIRVCNAGSTRRLRYQWPEAQHKFLLQ